MQVAVVGTGRWGRTLARAMAGQVRVAAICNRGDGPALAAAAAEVPGARATHDLSSVLQDESVDAVAFATPIATHASLALRALDCGKHVFVEKPLATTTADARSVVDAAVANGRVVFVGHVFRFDPAFLELVRVTRADPVVKAAACWTKTGTFVEDVHWNLLVHDVALALDLFRTPPAGARVLARAGFVTEVDAVRASLAFEGEATCDLAVHRASVERRKEWTVKTASGTVFAWTPGRLRRWDGTVFADALVDDRAPLDLEVAAFLECVAGKRDADMEHAVRVVETVERIVRSTVGCA